MNAWDLIHGTCVRCAGKLYFALDSVAIFLKRYIAWLDFHKIQLDNTKIFLWIVSLALVVVEHWLHWQIIEYILMVILGILFFAIYLPHFVFRARKSVLTCFTLICFVHALLVCFINVVFRLAFEIKISMVASVIIYGFLWVIFSLFAEEKVAKLANEIVSGSSVLIFTISTYCISLTTNEAIFSTLLKLSTERPWLAPESLKALADFPWTQFLLLIPGFWLLFIGLSCFSIMAVSIKQHWNEKYGFSKPTALQKL